MKHEQALGRAVRVGAGGVVTLSSTTSSRRAQGVYYTPPAIVDYLVHCTVAPLFAGHSLRRVQSIHIVDPACGSGSFLLGVYRYLLDWYRDAYLRGGDSFQVSQSPQASCPSASWANASPNTTANTAPTIAARPLGMISPRKPPSNSATASSNAAVVGLPLRP